MAYTDYLESGWDNAVRWGEAITRFGKASSKYRRQSPEIMMAPVEAIDLNYYIYVQRQTLADIAKLGLTGSAEEYRKLARETSEGVRRLMWDSSDGFYYDVCEEQTAIQTEPKTSSPLIFFLKVSKVAIRQ
jgi:neutral trehalase